MCVSYAANEDFFFTRQSITFTSEQPVLAIRIPIINDGLYEDSEVFFGDLLMVSSDFPRIAVNNNRTRITITNDDGEPLLVHSVMTC